MSSSEKSENVSDITFTESLLLGCFRKILFVFNYLNITSLLLLTKTITITLFNYWLSSVMVFWVSAFIYSMFYYVYIPLILTTKEIYLEYDSTCDTNCAIPFARIPLSQYLSNGEFTRGQMYRFEIDLHFPESDINWSQGMFMIRIKLFDNNQNIVRNDAKPLILRYKSPLMRIIYSLFYWPLLVIGFMDESQTFSLTLIDNFIEGSHKSYGPVTHALIEIEARSIQIFPPTILRISAHLTGLRYYMYYWPIISALFGISFIAFFISFFKFVSYTKRLSEEYNENELKSDFEENVDSTDDLLNNSTHLLNNDQNENESEESPTFQVIQQIEDFDFHNEDSYQAPDSSVG